jgi:hypothetical protein
VWFFNKNFFCSFCAIFFWFFMDNEMRFSWRFLCLSFAGYTTNSLTTVSVGKTSLDSHSHFRQPGE